MIKKERIKLSCLDYGIDIKIEDFEIEEITDLGIGFNLYLVPTDNKKIENNNRAIRLGILSNSTEANFLSEVLGNFKSFLEARNVLIKENISLAFVDNIPLAIIKDNNICVIGCQLDKNLELAELYDDNDIISLTKVFLCTNYGLSLKEFEEILDNELPKPKILRK